jgi:predicted TIM-barrel fold metal-dependent hydrolase
VVLFDGWALEADGLGKLALAVPEARLVVAHLGGVRFSDVLLFKALERYAFSRRNVWFDLSSVAQLYARSPYRDQLRWVCEQVGIDRVLFGSDFPLRSLADALDDVHALGFTKEQERAVLYANAEALFAPGPPPKAPAPAPPPTPAPPSSQNPAPAAPAPAPTPLPVSSAQPRS